MMESAGHDFSHTADPNEVTPTSQSRETEGCLDLELRGEFHEPHDNLYASQRRQRIHHHLTNHRIRLAGTVGNASDYATNDNRIEAGCKSHT